MTSSTKNYPGKSEVELQLSDSPSDAAAFPHPEGHRGVWMVGLVFVKPPTGLKLIWVWKHCRIPWRSVVAQGNQCLHGNSFAITCETHVQAICDEALQPVHVQRNSANRLTFLGMRYPPTWMSCSVMTRALAGMTGYNLESGKMFPFIFIYFIYSNRLTEIQIANGIRKPCLGEKVKQIRKDNSIT